MRWFELAMPGVYVLAGLLLLLTNVALDYIPNLRTPIAMVLIGYGAFRGWRTWKKRAEQP